MSTRLVVLAFAILVLTGCEQAEVPQRVANGDANTGHTVIRAIECGVCHVIPGVRGANGIVGPSLDQFGRRQLIAGVVPNSPGNLTTFVRNAPSIAPNTGMPSLPLSEQQARHVAAYLYTLR